MAEAVNPPEVWAPFGAFSMAVIQGDGRIVHLKGQVALDRDGQVVGAGDMRTQVRQTLDNIRDAIAAFIESLKKHHDPVPPSIWEEIVEVEP